MAPKRSQKPQSTDKKQSKTAKDAKKNTDPPKKSSKGDKGSTSKTGDSKMTLCTIPTVGVRPPQVRERRPGRPPSGKRLAMVRDMPAKVRSAFRRSLDPCDNSNDSGLGFDHHGDPHHLNMSDRLTWNGERAEAKRLKMDIKLENEEINDRYCFPETVRTCKDSTTLIRTAPAGSIPSLSMNNNQTSSSGRAVPRCIPLSNRQPSSSPVPLTTQLNYTSKYVSDVSLTIVKQPEQQHRARYQTEGSRGAVKDREGNGFPIVQLIGYYKPTTLQVFIGTDVGKVAPHMFYQACKVSGKNSTPCVEKKIDGTCVIELQLDPSKDMSATCDCVGILKERNVDVEHRFPDQLGNRSKKKSTRCRMIFRTTLTHDDGSQETLQVGSQPIVCTQPPGIPEICKKSLTSCPASGGLELFVLGKNFLKDTKVYFQQVDDDRHVRWEQQVVPDKEYLQQTHFVCVIPPYRRPDINEPVTVRLCVVSSGKTSEPHQFVYTPVNGAIPSVHVDPPPATTQAPFFNKMLWSSSVSKREQDLGMMPPPESSMVPMAPRRSSISLPSTSDNLSPPLRTLKQEYIDENSQSSVIDPMDHAERFRHISESSLDVHPGDSNMSMINDNSIDMLSHNNMLNHNENSNLSVSNESSVEMMVRRGSVSRPVCESSMDVNISNSQMSTINEDNSCSNVMQHCSNSVVTDRLVLSQPLLMQQSMLATASHRDVSAATAEELKVIDLRMKMPMATVADLVSSSAPSMATLQSFGVTEASDVPLPAQSAQSIENFLTNIENKAIQSDLQLKNAVSQKINEIINTETTAYCSPKVLNTSPVTSAQTCASLLPTTTNLTATEPVFLSSQRPFLTGTTENEGMLVAKSEAAAIAEQTVSQTSAITSSITTISAIENTIGVPINTEKLDQLVNSTVESHIGSPTRSEQPKDIIMSNKLMTSPTTAEPSSDVIRDVMLNSRSNLMVAPMINTTLSSPILNQHDLNPHTSPNLSPAVILNSQISPSLMCRNTQDPLLPNAICPPPISVESTLQPPVVPNILTTNTNHNSPLHSPIAVNNPLTLASDPEKVVLLKAAVDLLETQKKISELDSRKAMDGKEPIMNKMMEDIITMASSGGNDVMPTSRLSQLPGNNFVQPPLLSTVTPDMALLNKVAQDNKSDFVIPVPVKEITGVTQVDKKTEDRMIPQSFTSLTENELINFINPSCFDQGNNSNYH